MNESSAVASTPTPAVAVAAKPGAWTKEQLKLLPIAYRAFKAKQITRLELTTQLGGHTVEQIRAKLYSRNAKKAKVAGTPNHLKGVESRLLNLGLDPKVSSYLLLGGKGSLNSKQVEYINNTVNTKGVFSANIMIGENNSFIIKEVAPKK